MTPTAPYMKQCNVCKDTVDEYTDDFIQNAEKNFGNAEDCQVFLRNFKNHKSSAFDNYCTSCLRTKWRRQQQKYVDKLKSTQERRNSTPKQNKFTSKNYLLYRLVLSGIIIIFAFFIPSIISFITTQFNNCNNDNNISVNEDKLMLTITRLKDQFPSLQHRLFKKIGGAFKRLKTPGEPFVFLLLHDDTNKKTTDCLASYTSVLAKQNIFTNTTKSLWMNASEWTQYSDHDSTNQDLIYEKLIVPLKENEVLVLENLQDLPWSVAKSFHHLCDSENPQISKAMYILELRVNSDGLQQLTDGEKIVVAEQAMMKAWVDAPNSFRQALITRLTSYVDAVLLKSDEECSKELKMQSFIRISP